LKVRDVASLLGFGSIRFSQPHAKPFAPVGPSISRGERLDFIEADNVHVTPPLDAKLPLPGPAAKRQDLDTGERGGGFDRDARLGLQRSASSFVHVVRVIVVPQAAIGRWAGFWSAKVPSSPPDTLDP
jgi:hypothetical protein